MSVREMRTRLAEVLHRRQERAAFRRGKLVYWPNDVVRPAADRLLPAASDLVVGCKHHELAKLQDDFPDVFGALKKEAEERAGRIASGQWPLLEQPVNLTGAIDWHQDPISGYCWPQIFYADMQLYEVEGVDVKYVWELNRHQFLVSLSRAWLFSRDDRCAKRCRELLLDWIAQNPLYEGVNWTSGLELAVRGISWVWTLAGLANWPGWQVADTSLIVRSLAEHAGYLSHHLSLYSSPYNHLIGEATALYLLGIVLDGLPEASAWRKQGRSILAEHASKQFYADGFCVEQATGYHFFTLGFLAQAVIAARATNQPMPEVEEVVTRAFRTGAAFEQPDGRLPAIGDADSARSIPVRVDDFWDFRSVCALGAVLYNLPELKDSKYGPGEELFWLLGAQGVTSWNQLQDRSRPLRTFLPDSGYVVASSSESDGGRDWLLFDAGSLGDGLHSDSTPSTAHGHADVLQMLLHLDGKPILVDCGMPFYFGSRHWVDYFRSAGAHNTFEVVGLPAAQAAGRLEWRRVTERISLDANLTNEAWLMRGAVQLGEDVEIERDILGLPGRGIWVADRISTGTLRTARWYWNFPKDIELGLGSDGPHEVDVVCAQAALRVWGTQKWTARRNVPAASEPVAWHSPRYGSRNAGQRICVESEIDSKGLLLTYLGRWPQRAAVTLPKHWLTCSAGAVDLIPPSAPDLNAHIIWTIFSDDSTRTYAAGVPSAPLNPRWRSLDGLGEWGVYAMDDRGVSGGASEFASRTDSQGPCIERANTVGVRL